MPGRIILEVKQGPMDGRRFEFTEHDMFICGRHADCHASLPDDTKVSRHHFLLELIPPNVCLRDLGSRNGTWVNNIRYGGRSSLESPAQGAGQRFPEVALKDGDKLRVGRTVLSVGIEVVPVCCDCTVKIPDLHRENSVWSEGKVFCPACKMRAEREAQKEGPTPQLGVGAQGQLNELLSQPRPGADAPPTIEGFTIERLLAQGGMGAVFLARRKSDHRRVAIKQMLAKVAVNPKARQQFALEIDLLRHLHHPNIVMLLDYSSAGQGFYCAMELCEGGSVADLMTIRGGRVTVREAAPLMLDSLAGLAHAHAAGFVHRDLKPHNLLLTGPPARAKVGDFGLAKNFQQAGLSGMTMTGAAGGTVAYMPREQVINFRYVKPVSDVWSIAATFYHLLSGKLPRDHPLGVDPLQVVLNGQPVPLLHRDPTLPASLAEVIDRGLSINPTTRYADAGAMREALAQVL
jgi:pSer/pThr/pTyr-binding forkhead associated (FHA) protein